MSSVAVWVKESLVISTPYNLVSAAVVVKANGKLPGVLGVQIAYESSPKSVIAGKLITPTKFARSVCRGQLLAALSSNSHDGAALNSHKDRDGVIFSD